jgi:hypothetical protein
MQHKYGDGLFRMRFCSGPVAGGSYIADIETKKVFRKPTLFIS